MVMVNRRYSDTARASPGCDAHESRPKRVRSELGLPGQGRARLKRQVQWRENRVKGRNHQHWNTDRKRQRDCGPHGSEKSGFTLSTRDEVEGKEVKRSRRKTQAGI